MEPFDRAEQAGGAWATAPGTPPGNGSYGRASVPLNTVRPTSPAPVPGGPDRVVAGVGGLRPVGDPPGQPGGGPESRTTHPEPSVEAGAPRRSRTKLVAVLSVVVVLLIGAGVVGLVRPGPVKDWLGAAETTAPTIAATPDPTPKPVLIAATGGGTAPSETGVKAALDPLVGSSALGSKVHVAVLDVTSDQVLYSRNADVMTTPASTTKLLTAAAILAKRGPAYRLTTRVVAGARPGEVILVGGGDPTLALNAKGLFPGAARLDQLATRVRTALGGQKPTRVLVDTSLFSGPEEALGWSPEDISFGQVSRIQPLMLDGGRVKPVHNEFGGDPRSSDPAIAAGRAFAKLLGVSTSTVKRGKAPESGTQASTAPDASGAPGRELGRVQSPPLVQVTDWMLGQSDNSLADVLGRQVAIASGKPATFDGASEAIIEEMRALGLPGDEADLYDASGLSRHNGISPTLLTQLLRLAASGEQPALTSIFGGLPVAGWSGTLQKRFVSPKPNQVGQGLVRAKTGTLSGVNTMAGQLVTKDGRLLVFAIMASGSGSAVTGKAAVDKVVARLVACGC